MHITQDSFVIAAFVIVGLILIWPEIVLQAVGLVAFMAAPLGFAFDNDTSPVMVALVGLALVAFGRLLYTAKKAHRLLRLAHPEAADQVPVKRWI